MRFLKDFLRKGREMREELESKYIPGRTYNDYMKGRRGLTQKEWEKKREHGKHHGETSPRA